MAGSLTNALTGAATAMGYENSLCTPADPYGTALDLTSYSDGAGICAQITDNFTAEELEKDAVGCGASTGFIDDCQLGTREYRLGLTGDLGYANGANRLFAQYFGLASVPAEQNVGQGDYLHTFTIAANPNGHFGTFGYETSQTDVIELKSTFTERMQITMSEVNNFVNWSVDLLSNEIETVAASAVNDNADLQSLTIPHDELVLPTCGSKFLLKELLDDGTDIALADPADLFKITSYDLELERTLEVINEMTGGDCGAPLANEDPTGTLTIGIKEHVSNADTYTAWEQGKFYYCEIEWTGLQIGTGDLATYRISLPKLCLVASPGYNITSAGINSYSLTFRVLSSKNLIPGNFTTTGPQIQLINKRSTQYLVP